MTGTQKVHGIVTVPVNMHSKTYRLDVRLFASCQNLYGHNWIQATNVSINHIMREINKLTTVEVFHSDLGNDIHTHSEHGNETQPIVNMYNDILCDENGSGFDINSIYDVVCNNVLDHNTLEQVPV